MPVFEFQLSDGRNVEVESDVEPTEDELFSALSSWQEPQGQTPAAPQLEPPSWLTSPQGEVPAVPGGVMSPGVTEQIAQFSPLVDPMAPLTPDPAIANQFRSVLESPIRFERGIGEKVGDVASGAARTADMVRRGEILSPLAISRHSAFGQMARGGRRPTDLSNADKERVKALGQASIDRQKRLEETSPTYQWGQAQKQFSKQVFKGSPDIDDTFISELAVSAGGMLPDILASAVPVVGPTVAAASYGLQAGEQQAQEAIAAGMPETADVAFVSAAGLGAVSERLLGVAPNFWKLAKGSRLANLPPEQFGKAFTGWIAKNPAKAKILEGAGREAIQESGEQVGGNLIASDVAGYDPNRPATQGVGKAAAMGAVLGGLAGGGAALISPQVNPPAPEPSVSAPQPLIIPPEQTEQQRLAAQTIAIEPAVPIINSVPTDSKLKDSKPAEEVTLKSVLEMTPEQYFDTSSQWSAEAMSEKGGINPQVRAELAARANPDLKAWQEAQSKASEDFAAIKKQIAANPDLMNDATVQKRFSGAAQRASFFSEGRAILDGSKQPNARTVELSTETPNVPTRQANVPTSNVPTPPNPDVIQNLVPAVKYKGETHIGQPGETHAKLINRVFENDPEAKFELQNMTPESEAARGFSVKDTTEFIDRNTSAEMVGMKPENGKRPVLYTEWLNELRAKAKPAEPTSVNALPGDKAAVEPRSRGATAATPVDETVRKENLRKQALREVERQRPATPVRAKNAPTQLQELDELVIQHGLETGRIDDLELLHSPRETATSNIGSGIKAKVQYSAELKAARERVASDFGISKARMETPAGRSELLAKLKERAARPELPKLRPGEKGTGELLQGEETNQTDMFPEGVGEPSDWTRATEDIVEAVSPAEPGKASPPPATNIIEMGAGIPIPKFADRKMSPLDRVTTSHSGKLQKSFSEARLAQKEIKQAVPSERRQSAISIWREANGDIPTLQSWAAAAKGKVFKQAAIDAQSLTPKEIATAGKAVAAFDALEKRGNTFDVLKSHRDNYVPHVWDVKRPGSGFGTGMLKQRFRFSKARTFNTFFEGDQAGFKPKTLAIGKLLPAYIHEMNRVIADRQAVRDLAKGTMPDGSPMVVPKGNVKVVDGPSGKAVLVSPKAARVADTSDYRVMADQPALSNWIWEGKDTDGKPVFVNADLAVHPDVYRRLTATLGQSAIRAWYRDPVSGVAQIPRAIVRGLDTAQSAMKREMFGLLAPFHQVQEGWHGIAHRVNPLFGLEKINLVNNPRMADAANHGLMLLPDRASSQVYMEGVGTKSSLLSQGLRKTGKATAGVGEAIADVIDGYQDYLFHQYIPALKFKTYEAMVERNTELYAKELASGEMTPADVKLTSAEQSNAAYGHLNYALLDRNPTIQHLIQLSLLAPDFLEARARFAGQAVKGVRSKVGTEQLKAIAFIAAVQAGSAFLISQLLGVPYDKDHPFEVVYGGRRYALRSVPEDIFGLMKDTRQFVYSRVNPLTVKGGVQLATGLNYRGEKVSATDTIGELLAGYIPITARSIPGLRDLTETGRQSPITPLQQLAGSLGLRVSRYSPISETYKLAGDWMDKQKLAKDRGSYPVSKYQQLRYALEDGDLERAKIEYDALKKDTPARKVRDGFKQSLNHPFTGSDADDKKFVKTLTGYDRELYDQAIRTRKNILKAFNSL